MPILLIQANPGIALYLQEKKYLLEAEVRIEIQECNLRLIEYKQQITKLQGTKSAITQEIQATPFLPSQNTINRNLTLHQHNMVRGWVPSKQAYVLLQNNKTPPDAEVFKHISFEPETNLSNLPLSMSKLKTYSESIGADDKCLLNMIIQYC